MNLLTVLTWLLFIWQAKGAVNKSESENFIINGVRAKPGEFPYIVALFERGRFICTGSIINQHWVLTAAHCIRPHSFHHHVLVGGINIGEGQRYTVVRRVRHHMYNERTIENDICLLRVNEPFKFTTNVKRIQLNPNYIPLNVIVRVAGFGRTHPRLPRHGVLYWTNVTTTNCSPPKNNYFCAFNSVSSVCHGDSGGPLIYNNAIIGIVSHGSTGHCDSGLPDFHVRVSKYIHWIRSIARH